MCTPILNNEVLSNIFLELNDKKDFRNASEVCKQWHQAQFLVLPTHLRKLFSVEPELIGEPEREYIAYNSRENYFVKMGDITTLALHGNRFAYGEWRTGAQGPKCVVYLHDLKLREKTSYEIPLGTSVDVLYLAEKSLFVASKTYDWGASYKGYLPLEEEKETIIWEAKKNTFPSFVSDGRKNLGIFATRWTSEGHENTINLIDMETRKIVSSSPSLSNQSSFFYRNIMSISGEKVIYASNSLNNKKVICLNCYDSSNNQSRVREFLIEPAITAIASNSNVIAISTEENKVHILDINTLQNCHYDIEMPFISTEDNKSIAEEFIPKLHTHNNKAIASIIKNLLHVIDLNSGKVETVLKNVRQVVAFDGDWMAVSSSDPRIIKLWNFKTGLFIGKQTLGPVEALCFRQGSDTKLPCLLAALSRGKVQVWHLLEKEQPKEEVAKPAVDELESQLSKLQIN